MRSGANTTSRGEGARVRAALVAWLSAMALALSAPGAHADPVAGVDEPPRRSAEPGAPILWDVNTTPTGGAAPSREAGATSSAPWILVGAGGAVLSVGIALGAWSVIEHRRARDIDRPGRDARLDDAEQAEYDEAIALRDDLRIGSGIAAATALGLFVTGGVLFAIDELGDGAPRPGPAGPSAALAPAIGPAFTGGVLTARF